MYGLGLFKGLSITLKNMILVKRTNTVQYPDKKASVFDLAKQSNKNFISYMITNPLNSFKSFMGLISIKQQVDQHPRFRGEEFSWYEERCTGCASCAKYCPLGIIKIVTDQTGKHYQEGQSYDIETFDIDIGRCMFCGLCGEACPYDALHMGSGFEEGQYMRDNLVIDVDRLKKAEKKPSHWFRPQLSDKGDYSPFDAEIQWDSVGRHQKPSNQDLKNKWIRSESDDS